MKFLFLACALATVPSMALGQNLQPQSVPVPASMATNAVLRSGTEVPLKLSEELTTKGKKLRVGQRFRMETAEPVVVQGATVIPLGSPAMGEITQVKK